jgi:hypothetical protein
MNHILACLLACLLGWENMSIVIGIFLQKTPTPPPPTPHPLRTKMCHKKHLKGIYEMKFSKTKPKCQNMFWLQICVSTLHAVQLLMIKWFDYIFNCVFPKICATQNCWTKNEKIKKTLSKVNLLFYVVVGGLPRWIEILTSVCDHHRIHRFF